MTTTDLIQRIRLLLAVNRPKATVKGRKVVITWALPLVGTLRLSMEITI